MPDKEQEIVEKLLSLGIRLKAYRDAENLSQDKFCEKVGLSQAHYSLIEQGKVDSKVSSITKILSAFNDLTYGALFDEPEEPF